MSDCDYCKETRKNHEKLEGKHEKLEGKHEKLSDRIRDNEAKYMPAVDVAYEAKEEVKEIKKDMHEKLSNFSEANSIHDIKLDAVHKRMDVQDKQREAQASAIDSVHGDVSDINIAMVAMISSQKTALKIIVGIGAFLSTWLIVFGIWIVSENITYNTEMGNIKTQLSNLGGNKKDKKKTPKGK